MNLKGKLIVLAFIIFIIAMFIIDSDYMISLSIVLGIILGITFLILIASNISNKRANEKVRKHRAEQKERIGCTIE